MVGASLVEIVEHYRFSSIGVMRKVRDPRCGTVGMIVGAVLSVVVLRSSFVIVLLNSNVGLKFQQEFVQAGVNVNRLIDHVVEGLKARAAAHELNLDIVL
jgi:hypothetical protein